MIAEWNKYEINSLNLFKNLNSDQFWQPILYKLLEKRISEKPSCLYMIELIKNKDNFSDYIHLTDKGNTVLAESISLKIKDVLRK